MGSQRRRDAIAAGKIVENAAAVRRRRRQEAAIMREELAIEMWAKGATAREISDELFARYGVRLVGNIPELVRRGLFRRVEGNKHNVDIAREMLLTQYRQYLAVYSPRGLGELKDDDGNAIPPDIRAAELALKYLDKIGIATGAISPPRSGGINLNFVIPPNADTQRGQILESLEAERDKQREIESALAGTPAIEGQIVDVHDGKIMPPVPLGPAKPPGEG